MGSIQRSNSQLGNSQSTHGEAKCQSKVTKLFFIFTLTRGTFETDPARCGCYVLCDGLGKLFWALHHGGLRKERADPRAPQPARRRRDGSARVPPATGWMSAIAALVLARKSVPSSTSIRTSGFSLDCIERKEGRIILHGSWNSNNIRVMVAGFDDKMQPSLCRFNLVLL